MQWVPGVSRG